MTRKGDPRLLFGILVVRHVSGDSGHRTSPHMLESRVLTQLGPTTLLSRLLVLSLFAGCMLGDPGDPVGVETAEGYALAPGPYQIEAAHSGKCADIAGASLLDGANIHQWDCHGRANQQWILRDLGTGYYE